MDGCGFISLPSKHFKIIAKALNHFRYEHITFVFQKLTPELKLALINPLNKIQSSSF